MFEVTGPLLDWRFDLDMGTWMGVDMVLEEKFAEREDFRLIFRMEEVNGWENFQRHIMDRFPWLRERGRVHFE